ncbi:hypothetical protein V493_00777 [Pseudogymnoascus sp. VKM F-4281 (FW-2241)]|nr:hypothetical protein V493_00777 [Pseudogymnoascus sp. VKM F-4281 (FW-2241)]
MFLARFDLEYIHVPGKELVVADGLSRFNLFTTSPLTSANSFLTSQDIGYESEEEMDLQALAVEVRPQPSWPRDAPPLHAADLGAADILQGWESWVDDPWYGDIVKYKATNAFPLNSELDPTERKYLRRMATKFRMWDSADGPRLLYIERNGTKSRCIQKENVENELRVLHNLHGHFATRILQREVIGKAYWPSRMKDINAYCQSCPACQAVGPLRPSTGLNPIFEMMPFDLVGIDFLGPIFPVSKRGNKYILLSVDYFSRYLIAKPTVNAKSTTVVTFIDESICTPFGNPLAFYSDNGKHFVSQETTSHLHSRGIRTATAPITHPLSVGLAERYVQMILAVYRKILQQQPDLILEWDELLPHVVNVVNTKKVTLYGVSPAELLFGFKPRFTAGDLSIDEAIRSEMLSQPNHISDVSPEATVSAIGVRLAKLDELRDAAAEIRLRRQLKQSEESAVRFANTKKVKRGDLVLLRRLAQDNQHSHKLEPRWQGPYIVHKVSPHGASAFLRELHSNSIKGRYHTNDLKLFVERQQHNTLDEPYERLFSRNETQRLQMGHQLQLSDTEIRRRANLQRELGVPMFDEDDNFQEHHPQPNPQWWEDYVHFPANTADKPDPAYWAPRQVHLDHL